MSLLLRLLVVLIRALRAPRTDVLAASVLRFRVMPDDLDVNVHMNNVRYLALMDLARLDVLVRAGLYRPLGHRGRWPVVGSTLVRYRRSLQPFQRFQLHTRVLGWDDRWFFFEQRFESGGQIHCTCLSRGMFRSAEGTVAPALALEEAGFGARSPELPEYVRRWTTADDEAYAAAARAAGRDQGRGG